MAIGRYVVVNSDEKTIVGGPYKWDPERSPEWTSPEEGTVMLESEAGEQGYTWPE